MGVKGHSLFSKLKYPFDLVFSFAIDWTHCVSLGSVKHVMTLLIEDKGRSYFIGAACYKVGRYPRGLTEKLVIALFLTSNAFLTQQVSIRGPPVDF